VVLAGALAFAACAPAFAQPAPASPSASDFVTAVSQTDEYERQAGRIAQNSGLTARVRDYATMMVKDHGKTSQALKAAADQAGLGAASRAHISNDQVQLLNTLNYNIGMPTFDGVYMDQQIKVHQKTLDVVQAYAASGDNEALRGAAAKLAPLIHQHLAMAQDVKAGLRNKR
jgi:putative membrane protein